MAWDKRRCGRRYYCRSVWVDGRSVKQYVGAGAAGRAAADRDQLDRLDRRAKRDAWAAWDAKVDEATPPLDRFCETADLIVRAALIVSGYHYHRGEWRRRNEGPGCLGSSHP
jgi:hypothetical protein